MTIIVGLMTIYFVALLFFLWWMYAAIRRQRNNDLRYHRNILLDHIHTELTMQESRLIDRLRVLK